MWDTRFGPFYSRAASWHTVRRRVRADVIAPPRHSGPPFRGAA